MRGSGDCQHLGGRERGLSYMVNICESLQDRQLRHAKGADILSLNQNGVRPGSGVDVSPDADVAPSVYGWNLSHL